MFSHRPSISVERRTAAQDRDPFEGWGATRYGVDMIADGFAVLAKASGKTVDDLAE